MNNIYNILKQLENNNLLNENTLVMIKSGKNKVVYDYIGHELECHLFDHINSNYAVFTYSMSSKEISELGKKIYPATDDQAQMFGASLKCVKSVPYKPCIIKNKGFITVGRTEGELITSAILIEKMCFIELSSKKIGKPHRLNGFLCILEHLVYKYSYSKKSINK